MNIIAAMPKGVGIIVAAIEPASAHLHFLLCIANIPPTIASASIASPGITIKNKDKFKENIPAFNGVIIIGPIANNNNTNRLRLPTTISKIPATVGIQVFFTAVSIQTSLFLLALVLLLR